jgi:predicted DsbA family dithiol-disulfide isomerase
MLVEIWSDVVCPWCAIGKVRFERALAAHPRQDEVEVRWRSFELDPSAPATREGDYATMLATKYRTTRDQAQAMIDRMVDTAAQEGLDFDFTIARPGNTFDAHRVLHLAADHGRQHEVKDRFLRGYHSEGEGIGEHATITRLAVDAGLDQDEVAAVLAGDAYAQAVRADEAQAHEYGISGVPFFVLDRRLGVSGAQPTEVLREALDQALPSRSLLSVPTAGEGDACGIDGC